MFHQNHVFGDTVGPDRVAAAAPRQESSEATRKRLQAEEMRMR